MAYKITNNTLDNIGWGSEVIIPGGYLVLSNTAISNGSATLTFDQFADNTNAAVADELEVYNGLILELEPVLWIESYYNDPLIAYDNAAGTGDMQASTYDQDLSGVVDASESIIIPTANPAGIVGNLASFVPPLNITNVIGVFDGISGKVITEGSGILNVHNRSGGDAALIAGSYVYMDSVNKHYGQAKHVIPTGIMLSSLDEPFIGYIAEDTPVILDGEFYQAKVYVNVSVEAVNNPDADGKWLRSKDGEINSWTEEINGGTY